MKQLLAIIMLLCTCFLHLSAIKPIRTYINASDIRHNSLTLFPNPPIEAAARAVEIRASCADPGKKSANKDYAYGVAFAMTPDGSFLYAMLSAGDSDFYDSTIDSRHVLLTVASCDSTGRSQDIFTTKLTSHVDVQRIENSIAIEIDCLTGCADILVGDNLLERIHSVQLSGEQVNGPMGILTRGTPDVMFAVVEYTPNPDGAIQTSWTADSINSYLNNPDKHQIEGIWTYLDRDMDARYCRPGGDYTLAIVADRNNAGYDIIYLDGAQTARSEWQPGMKKGHLSPTQFLNHFDLVWYDSTMTIVDSECSASMDQNAILKLEFPLLKATMRLAKHPDR